MDSATEDIMVAIMIVITVVITVGITAGTMNIMMITTVDTMAGVIMGVGIMEVGIMEVGIMEVIMEVITVVASICAFAVYASLL